mmetsp:Transcript_18499/g.51820  ORF Transcript_18499/g.51820 Transcript_18499/m.51820 type:complete len:231 (+) Transcript_18499:120-812(+)
MGEEPQDSPEPLGLAAGPREMISQGAEGRVFKTMFLQRPAIAKERFRKKYRHPTLDAKLTKSRCNGEVRSMARARKMGLRTPVIYLVEQEANTIYMEFIDGVSVKEVLQSGTASPDEEARILVAVGEAVAVLHDGGLIHGDLTTSNLMVEKGTDKLVVIDFGLAYNSVVPEDKAVDLYVLERAFTSAHPEQEGLFEQVLEAYRKNTRQWIPTMKKFAEVRMRGRKRSMVG